jgi:hypothetical protein
MLDNVVATCNNRYIKKEEPHMSYVYQNDVAFVAHDGSYSQSEEIVVFGMDDLTEEQWSILSELSDSERIVFALACLNGEDIQEYLDEFYL